MFTCVTELTFVDAGCGVLCSLMSAKIDPAETHVYERAAEWSQRSPRSQKVAGLIRDRAVPRVLRMVLVVSSLNAQQ